jgi:hypothetical protein
MLYFSIQQLLHFNSAKRHTSLAAYLCSETRLNAPFDILVMSLFTLMAIIELAIALSSGRAVSPRVI